MSDRGHSSRTLRADFAEAFDGESYDKAEIDQLTEEYDLSDPKRTKINSLPFSTAKRLEIFDRLAGGRPLRRDAP